MMQNEWLEAMGEAAHITPLTRFGKMFSLSAKTIDPIFWQVITEAYCSKEMDRVCSGPDRHKKFAAWCANNVEWLLVRWTAKRDAIDERVTALTEDIKHLQQRIELIKSGFTLNETT